MAHRYNKDTREKILTEADRLFMSQGYLGTSTRQIAKNAGVTQPNLYHYFKDKETLYTAVIEGLLQEVGGKLRGILDDPSKGFQEALTGMAEYLVNTHIVDLFVMLHDLETHISRTTRDRLFSLWKQYYRGPFEELFQQNNDRLRKGVSPETAARHFFLVLAPYIKQETNREQTSLMVQELIDLFLNGVQE